MPQENVEVVRAAIEALSRADLSGAMKDTTPDFVLDVSRSVSPARGVYERREVASYMEEFGMGPWDSVVYEVHDFIAAADVVVTPMTSHNRGRGGIEVQARAAWVWSFREGRIARVTLFQEPREALEAVGLSE